jgi:hypothetical protein
VRHYRYPIDRVPPHTSSKSRQRVGYASGHRHVARNSISRLLAQEGTGAVTCSTALNPATQYGRAPVLPRVPQLQTPPPSSGGLWCFCVSRGSGSCLLMQEGSGAATCPMKFSGLWAMRINIINLGHAARTACYHGKYARYQGKPSSWTCNTCSRWRIKCLQDVWTDGCRTAIVQHLLGNHSQCVATVPNDLTAQCGRTTTVPSNTTARRHAAHECDVARQRGRTFSTPLKTLFTTPS